MHRLGRKASETLIEMALSADALFQRNLTADNGYENHPDGAVSSDSEERCPAAGRQASAASVRQTLALAVKSPVELAVLSGAEADGCSSLSASSAFPKPCGEA